MFSSDVDGILVMNLPALERMCSEFAIKQWKATNPDKLGFLAFGNELTMSGKNVLGVYYQL